jgi:hypothetical protein
MASKADKQARRDANKVRRATRKGAQDRAKLGLTDDGSSPDATPAKSPATLYYIIGGVVLAVVVIVILIKARKK